MEIRSEDILILRRAMRDLVALTTLPAVWTDYTPHAIAESLSDVLISALHADFVSIQFKTNGNTIDVARTSQTLYTGQQAAQLALGIDASLEPDALRPMQTILDPLGSGSALRSATMPIDYEGIHGQILVGTYAHSVFSSTDVLLMRVAANQAAIALRQSQLMVDLKAANEQKDKLLAQEQESRRRTEDAIRARDEFLSVASHELKTPITSLRGFVQLLLRRIDKTGAIDISQLQRALQTIDAQSAKLIHLISQLLDLSRIEAGRLTLEPGPTDIAALVQNAANAISRNSDQHSIAVHTPPSVLAFVDALRLEQVVANLLDNAIKYSPDGGPIDVTLALPDERTLRLIVADRGVGIPAERRPYIFDRFYQAHGEGYKGGMGLGLYISRQIVEQHGGTLEPEFPDEGGSRFVVSLPLVAVSDT